MAEKSKQKMEAADEEVESFSEESEDSDFDKEYTCDLCKTSFSGLKPLKQHERSSKHQKVLRRQKLNKEIDEDLKDLNLDGDSGDEDFSIKKIVAECEICNKVFNGPESYRQHIKSKIHKRKLKEDKLIEMAKEDGKINIEKLKKLLHAGNTSSTGEASTEMVDSDEDIYRCEDCHKTFTGLTPLRDHLVSKSHKNTLKENSLKEKLVAASDDENGIDMDEDFLVCKICKMSFSGPSNVIAHLKGKNHTNMVEFLKWKREKKRLKKEREEKSVSSELVQGGSDSQEIVDNETSNKDEFSHPDDVRENLNASKTESYHDKEKSRENTWKTYESYKNYKKVMYDSKTEI